TGMTAHLSDLDRSRLRRAGVVPLDNDEGLALFDAALSLDEAVVLPVHLDLAALQSRASGLGVTPLLRSLVRTRRSAAGGGVAASVLKQRLEGLGEAEREAAVLELVRGEVAVVLGHAGANLVDVDRAFQELGFDS